jgi:ApbE superfamily uncharacterized protein (UPF0280 family)
MARRPESYIQRDYRRISETCDLISSYVRIEDTDLHVLADLNVSNVAKDFVLKYRLQIENFIHKHPEFLSSLSPLSYDFVPSPLIKEMLAVGVIASVGPMAAVAGGIAEYVGKDLLAHGCREVVVENGGDVFLYRTKDCTVAIFAGESPLSMRIGLKLPAAIMPVAICTSSGTVGHSLSFGKADSVTVLARSTLLADAVATRLGNEVGSSLAGDPGIKKALSLGRMIEGVLGVVVICGEAIGAVGDVELIRIG